MLRIALDSGYPYGSHMLSLSPWTTNKSVHRRFLRREKQCNEQYIKGKTDNEVLVWFGLVWFGLVWFGEIETAHGRETKY